MKFIKTFLKAIDATNCWVGNILQYFLFGFFVLLLLEVIRRYLFNAPTVWGNELAQMLFGAYAILSGGVVLRVNGHVNVDIIYANLSPKTRAKCDIATSVFFFLFVGVMVWMGWEMGWESLSRFETSESTWNPPVWPLKMMILVGSILLLLQGVSKLIVDILILLNIESPIGHEVKEGETL